MATEQQQLDALKAMKRSGVRSTTVDGRTVEYRSMKELDRAIADLEDSIAKSSGTPRPRVGFVKFSRGW